MPVMTPIDSYFFPLSLWHTKKGGTKSYSYSDIIALLIFTFPKMNNFCSSPTVIKRNRSDVQKHWDCHRKASWRTFTLLIFSPQAGSCLWRCMRNKITTKSGKQMDGIRGGLQTHK